MTEYLVVLVLAALGMAAAMVPLGVLLLRYWDVIDALVGLPFP